MKAQAKIPKTIAIVVVLIIVTFIILAIAYALYTGGLGGIESFISEKKAFKP